MASAWEIREANQVLVGILHTEITTLAWSFGVRNLIVPGRDDLRKFYPFMPVAGQPFDMGRNSICQRALDLGCQYCFRPDVIVETSRGGKKIKDVQKGDLVRTHLGKWRRVEAVSKRELKQGRPLIWVKTANDVIKCTDEHPFFVCRDGTNQFLPAKELGSSDHLLYPSTDGGGDQVEFGIRFNSIGMDGDGRRGSLKNGRRLGTVKITPELARFFGLYLAEGCATYDGICFTFHNEEAEYVEVIRSVAAALFSRKPSITSRWATNVKINVRPLSALFAGWFGRGARSKRIPPFVFQWSLHHRLHFLRGYLEGDGCFAKTGVVHFSTSSSRLAKDVVKLAVSCGMAVQTRRKAAYSAVMSTGQEIHSGPSWIGWFAKKSTQKMSDLLAANQVGGYLQIPIKAVEPHKMPANAPDPHVYNLQVEEDESYIVDCAAVHNCFFLDSDVVAPPDTIPRLIAHNQPLISGVYYRRSPPLGVPVMLRDGQYLQHYPIPAVIPVDLVGAGCLLLRRDFLERIPPQRPGARWFDWRVNLLGVPGVDPGGCKSEDYTLMEHAKKHGWQPVVDTSIQCRHIGASESRLNFESMTPDYRPLEALA